MHKLIYLLELKLMKIFVSNIAKNVQSAKVVIDVLSGD